MCRSFDVTHGIGPTGIMEPYCSSSCMNKSKVAVAAQSKYCYDSGATFSLLPVSDKWGFRSSCLMTVLCSPVNETLSLGFRVYLGDQSVQPYIIVKSCYSRF